MVSHDPATRLIPAANMFENVTCAICTRKFKADEVCGLIGVEVVNADTWAKSIVLRPVHIGCTRE